MTTILQLCLWAFIITEVIDITAPVLEKLKTRRKLKRLVKSNMRLYENADSDYKAGFFYGKAKLFEQKLKETRYFYYD